MVHVNGACSGVANTGRDHTWTLRFLDEAVPEPGGQWLLRAVAGMRRSVAPGSAGAAISTRIRMSGNTPSPGIPRLAVLGSRSAFTEHAVNALCESGVPPVALMIGADPASRAQGPIPVEVRAPAARLAVAHGAVLIRATSPNHPDAIAALERVGPDLILLACLPHVAGRAVRQTAGLGALNLHPSALPRFRGPDPVFWQLRAGIARAGVTVHVATGAVDAGPIVVQRRFSVEPGIGAGALTARLVRGGIHALMEALPGIERRIREAAPQDESAATRQPWPQAGDFRLDTSWTAERAYRFIEGVRGPATTFTVIGDEGEIEVERAIGFDPRARPGWGVERSGGIVTIRFAEGTLRAVPARASRASRGR